MIPVSRLVAATALLVAVGAHGAALIVRAGPDQVLIEGGAPAAVTALGNAFADMVAGTNTPVDADVNEAETTPDKAQKPDPAKVTAKEPPQRDTPQETPPETPTTTAQSTPPADAKPAATPLQQETSRAATLTAQMPMVEPTPSTEPLPATQPLVTETPAPLAQTTVTQQPPETTQTTPALTYNEPSADRAEMAAIRPVARPVTRPVAKPVKPTKAIRPEVKQKPKPKAKPRPQGNSTKNAKRGTATGTQPKAEAKSGTTSARATAQGNAAASNYKGLVFRKINRAKRRVNIKGTVRISFGISASGALSRLSVSRSSGSAKLDQVALQQVRRAAPFGPPPKGAQRSFSVEIRGKK